ncbi:MAG: hypothetical protein HY691_03300 [Chloroflexi bacterium]|nr:hypothetical protein [Chloroflexota bacterium]
MAQRIVKRPPVSAEAVVLTPPPMAPRAAAARPEVQQAEEEHRRAKQHAAQLLARAREDAAGLLDEARAEAQRLREVAAREGREEGTARGYQEGRSTGQQEAERAVQEAAEATIGAYLRQLGALVARAQADRIALIRDAEADLVELALAIAEKVLHQRLTAGERAAVLDIARAALERLAAVGSDGARLRVHPSDYEAFREVWDELELGGAAGLPCQVVPDERVEAGGCLVEARAARIDAQWSTQLAQVRGALLGVSPGADGLARAATGATGDAAAERGAGRAAGWAAVGDAAVGSEPENGEAMADAAGHEA